MKLNHAAAVAAVAVCLLASLGSDGWAQGTSSSSSSKGPGDVKLPSGDRATADVMVILAEQGDGGESVDARIGRLPQLKQPPLSAFHVFTLLDRKPLALVKGVPAELPLPNGRTLRVSLTDVTSDRRFALTVAISQPGGPSFLKVLDVKAAPGEPFFVAGQTFKGGTLVLGLSVKAP
jgi:hypothetical protein